MSDQNSNEGVIKFNCIWTKDDALDSVKLRELSFWRNRLYQLGLIGAYTDCTGFGNISCRIGNNNDFIVSGTQTGHLVHADENHFCLVHKFDLEKNEVHCSGPVKASSESLTHGACYLANPEINVVMHVHHKQMWEGMKNILPTIPIQIDYGTPAMALAIANEIRSNSQNERVIVMEGHEDGIIFFGKNFEFCYNLISAGLK